MEEKIEYKYHGAVTVNGKFNEYYIASTMASSEDEARRNIIYKYRKFANLPNKAKIELVDKIKHENLYVFEGEVYINDDIVYVGYRDVAYGFNVPTAFSRIRNKFIKKQYLSDSLNVKLKGKITKKENKNELL